MRIANYDLHLVHGWKFHLGKIVRYDARPAFVYDMSKAGRELGYFEDIKEKNTWQEVRVPHDWMAALPVDPTAIAANGYKQRGEGWYYIDFSLSDSPIERAKLVFEGVLGSTVVYVNGTIAGRNFSGYNRFAFEIASYLLPGQENVIALKVDTTEWEAWNYEGAGLYRPVRIEFREETRLDVFGSFVRGEEQNGKWQVKADVKCLGNLTDTILVSTLTTPCGEVVSKEVAAKNNTTLQFDVENAVLWSPEQPNLYHVSCALVRNGKTLDALHVNVGLRTVTWDKNGMRLNGEKYLIKGICCHQDHGGVGAAVTPEINEFRVKKLKELGANAYRCAHHAVPESFLELCDRYGLLVMVENRHYSVSKETKEQLESLVLAARNHPCVFIYSLFNEEPWQTEARGYYMAKEMREWILALDDTRAVTGAINLPVGEELNAAHALDVVGLNYQNQDYQRIHALFPEKCILGTENCPTFATRGVYQTDEKAQVFNSYGDHFAAFTVSIDETMQSVYENDFVAGCFPWSGFDSYGEPAPFEFPSVLSHWGFLDICGFEKDTAYLLSAYYQKELMLHLFPHWNWELNETVRVCAFTNADTVELFVNGESCGEVLVQNCRAEWQVKYAPGNICAVAKRGEETVASKRVTAGDAEKLLLEDVTPTVENQTVKIVNVSVVDQNGTVLPACDKTICLDKAAELLGIANGNPNGTQDNVVYEIKLFHGHAQMIVTADSVVTVRCDGLDSETLS